MPGVVVLDSWGVKQVVTSSLEVKQLASYCLDLLVPEQEEERDLCGQAPTQLILEKKLEQEEGRDVCCQAPTQIISEKKSEPDVTKKVKESKEPRSKSTPRNKVLAIVEILPEAQV